MAIAITKFQAYALNVSDTGRNRCVQRTLMTIAGANSDTDWDIGDLTPGTFWTSAVAHATYGSIASAALTMLTNIATNAKAFVGMKGSIDNDYLREASVGASAYTLSVTSCLPIIAFNTTDAPTTATVVFEFEMNDSIPEYVADIGA